MVFPEYNLASLEAALRTEELVQVKSNSFMEEHISQQRKQAKQVEGRIEFSPATNESPEDRDLRSATQEAAKENELENTESAQPVESATSSKLRKIGRKIRGQLILRRVWDIENQGKVPPQDSLEFHQSRVDESKTLEYVKVYRAKDEERLDFSEEEGDEVRNNRFLDSGELFLHADQVLRIMCRYRCSYAGSDCGYPSLRT